MQDRNSDIFSDSSSFFKSYQEWLPTYLSLEERALIIDKVAKRLTDDGYGIRTRAIQALKELQAKGENDKIIDYLADNDSDVRKTAIEVLAQLQIRKAIPKIIERLADKSPEVSEAAIAALGQLQAREAIPQFIELLSHNDSNRKDEIIATVKVLGQLQATQAIPDLMVLLNAQDDEIREAAIIALGQLQATQAIPDLMVLLNAQDDEIRRAAIIALGQLRVTNAIPTITASLTNTGKYNAPTLLRIAATQALVQLQGKDAIPILIKFLFDYDDYVREAVITAFVQLQAKEIVAPKLIEFLPYSDSINPHAERIAIKALEQLQAKEAIPVIIKFLADDKWREHEAAITALGQLQAKEAIPKLIGFLSSSRDDAVQRVAIVALGQLQAKEAIPKLIGFLSSSRNDAVQRVAIVALGQLQAKEAIPNLIDIAIQATYRRDVEVIAIETLGRLQTEEKQLAPQALFFVGIHNQLDELYESTENTKRNRFIAHLLAGSRFQTLVWCLGNNDRQDCNKQIFQGNHDNTIAALRLFKDFYQAIPKDKFSPKLRDDLVVKINMVAEALLEQQVELTFVKLRQELAASQNLSSKFKVIAEVFAAKEEVALLDDISKLIEKDGYDVNDLKRKRDAILETQEWLQQVTEYGSIICLHIGFWIILIFLYPRSRMIQAIFFWNPWVQNIIGLGYVGFCLTWIPFLRRRLLSPFKESLLADANLATFKPELYFASMSITLKGLNEPQPLLETLVKSTGQIILEGESGLGKTMYLRYLAQRSKRPFAFLHATRCTEGVIPALKEKLHGFAKNEHFLTNIIYAGGVDLCIDGLNEVSPDSRAKITQFVEQHFKGTILLSTQPLEWQPPATAKTYRLLPLNRQQIEAFLLSRPEQPENYAQTCHDYLNAALSPQLDRALHELHLKILSNPMDLTVVAHLLAQGIQPNLDNLIQQQYQTMSEDYQSKSFNQNFPLNKFAQHVFDIRLQDKRVLNHADFDKELDCLETHKLVVKRLEKNGADEHENYYFRHDKIWDFFNAHVFKQHDNEWRKQYFADERFRGAFLALAWSLPLTEAQSLLDELQHYIVKSNDNILHHQYYQLIDLRKRLQRL